MPRRATGEIPNDGQQVAAAEAVGGTDTHMHTYTLRLRLRNRARNAWQALCRRGVEAGRRRGREATVCVRGGAGELAGIMAWATWQHM